MELQNNNKQRRKPSVDLSTMIYGKVPPQAKDMETAVLGAIMLEPAALDVVDHLLRPESFYLDANQRIYRAIQNLQKRGQAYDILLVIEELRKNNELEMVGGPYYVTRLTNEVVSAANIEEHARVIVQKYTAREAIRIAGQMISDAYEDSTDVFDLVHRAEDDLSRLSLKSAGNGYTGIAGEVVKEYSRLEEARHRQKGLTGIPTGLRLVDEFTCGWQPGDFIILAARPSCGKTALSLNLALNAAKDKHTPTPTGYFSLEMPVYKLVDRMAAAISKTPLEKIKKARLSDEDMRQLHHGAFQPLSGVPLFFASKPAMSIQEFKAIARRMVHKDKVGLIIIDYLQLMTAPGNQKNREREIAEISAGIKALALSLNIPIIALSQLSRDIMKRPGGAFQLSDLRDSGSLEQDADVVLFIHKPSKEEVLQAAELKDTAKIFFAKNRDGELGDITLNFYGEYQLWTDLQSPWNANPRSFVPPARDFTVSGRIENEDDQNYF